MRVYVDTETGELVEALPSDVSNREPYTYEQAKRAVLQATRERRDAERELRAAVTEKGDAEADYRRKLASHLLIAKSEHGATVAEAAAKGVEEVAEAKRRAVVAEGLVRAALERLRLCSEDRASLHRLIEWSMRAPGADEGVGPS